MSAAGKKPDISELSSERLSTTCRGKIAILCCELQETAADASQCHERRIYQGLRGRKLRRTYICDSIGPRRLRDNRPENPDFDQVAARVISETSKLYGNESRIQDAWRALESVKDVAVNERVLGLLQFAYGRRPVPFQTLNFRVGTEQLTHSDTIHFDCFPRNFMCGVWVAYEDAEIENGALHYFPGSHRLPSFVLEDLGISRATLATRTATYQKYEMAIADFIARNGMGKAVVPVKKGQALVWTANLFHGGEPIQNRSRTRHSQVTHCYFADCVYTQPLWSDMYVGRISIKKCLIYHPGDISRRNTTEEI